MADKISEFNAVGKMNTTISGKMLYMLLNELADKNGVINISHIRLSRILGINKSTVSKNLRRLEQSGDIYIRSRYTRDGGRMANEYIVR